MVSFVLGLIFLITLGHLGLEFLAPTVGLFGRRLVKYLLHSVGGLSVEAYGGFEYLVRYSG